MILRSAESGQLVKVAQAHAIDVAYSMFEEFNSIVWVEDYLGHTVIELGDHMGTYSH